MAALYRIIADGGALSVIVDLVCKQLPISSLSAVSVLAGAGDLAAWFVCRLRRFSDFKHEAELVCQRLRMDQADSVTGLVLSDRFNPGWNSLSAFFTMEF